MKYRDSMVQANEKMQQVMMFLNRHLLAANPLNYAVAYEHISGINPALSQVIEKREITLKPFDNFIMENLYTDLVLKQSDLQEDIVAHLDNMLEGINEQSAESDQAINHYLDMLDSGLVALDADADHHTKMVIDQLVSATVEIKANQQQLQQQLKGTCSETARLRSTLEDIDRERSVDTLTGLNNSKAIEAHMDVWLDGVPSREIAAIAIDIDHFSRFNDNYGSMAGDVILAKIAKKISTYVSHSGLPVRVGGEEFLILLPDVDMTTAKEVAEQVRKGVEKMKFVSARSKRLLPSVTISAGISSYRDNEALDLFVGRADNALNHAKNSGRNRVMSENWLS